MNWKLLVKLFILLIVMVTFKYSFDAYSSGSLLQTFGTFFLGLVSLTIFVMFSVDDTPDKYSNPA